MDSDRSIRELFEKSVPREAFIELEKRLKQARRILYIRDNCGEIVFDSLDEEVHIETPIYFMLMCKCPPYRDLFGVPIGEPILSAARSKNAS